MVSSPPGTVTIAAEPVMGATTGVMVPLYVYPSTTTAWSPVAAAKAASPSVPVVAIVNPDSGVGTTEDPNYAAAIRYLQANGVATVGYVDTAYGSNSLAEMETEMSTYMSWYEVNGFFFDDLASSGQEAALAGLAEYATVLGAPLTVGNPGTSFDSGYSGLLSTYVVYEGVEAAVPLPAVAEAYVVYSAPSFPSALVQELKGTATYLFVASAGPPGQYQVVSPYLAQLAVALG